MEVIKLPPGELAPKESDCISIEEKADGSYQLNTSALSNCGGENGDEAESMSVIGSQPYKSYEEAEAAGLVIAAEQCVGTLFVSRMPVEDD